MTSNSASHMTPGIVSGQDPPFYEMDSILFQKLCRDIFDVEPTVSTCDVYGVIGEGQYGIDLRAFRRNGDGIEVGQCKCHEDFPPHKIRAVSDEFFKHWESHWSKRNVKRFILFVACDLSKINRQEEISKQTKYFAKYGIKYEAWSAAQIRNKLRPHPGIVSSYLHPSNHWIKEICGTLTHPSSVVENTAAQPSVVITSALENQISQLSGHASEDTAEQLKRMRREWQEGHTSKVKQWLESLRNGKWPFLSSEVKANVLLLEAGIELEENRDISRARKLADEAQEFMPSQNQVCFRAMIVYYEEGPEEAMGLLDNQDDIDSLNLKAALLLDLGRVEEALDVVDFEDESKLKLNAETYRIKALGHLLSKNLAQARLEISKALEQEPYRKVVRETAAIINYFSALSPVALPDRLVQCPEPESWLFIKRDDDSLIRLRSAAAIFKTLSGEIEDEKEKKILQCWHLACLANDPDKQEKAIDYCRKLLQYDPTNFWAIEWATHRNYGLDLEPSEKALRSIIEEGSSNISHVISLVICKLASQKIVEAIEVLNDSESQFKSQEEIRVWTSLYVKSLVAKDDPQSTLTVIDQSGLKENLYYDKMIALQAIAQKTGDWQPLVEFLEDAYEETGDTSFLFNCCSLMVEQGNWKYVTKRSQQLIDGIGTPEALRLAAIASYNNKQFDICLRLLDDYRNLFEGGLLPPELRILRVSCLNMLGAVPEAIQEAESLVNEEPNTDNLLALMDLYRETGNLKKLAIIARQHRELLDLTQQDLLRIAYLVKLEDSDLAISFWEKAVSGDVSDDLVGEIVHLGFQLGLDEELNPFLVKMGELGESEKGGFSILEIKDIIEFAKQRREHLETIVDVYDQGTLPIQVIAEMLNQSLLDPFHYHLSENEKSPNSRNQFYLLARHGGRKIPSGFPDERPQWRLNLDITAVLLAAHLDILSKVENTFAPLRIPKTLIPILLEMKNKLTHSQPSRLQIAEQIIDIESQGLLNIWEYEATSSDRDTELIEEMGEHWVAVFERARKENGFIACFLPLKTQNMSSTITLPDEAHKYIVNCCALVDSLYKQGPLSEAEYEQTLEKLGSEAQKNPNGVIPQQGRRIFLEGSGIATVLAEVDMLRTVCDRFEVYLEKSELDDLRDELESHRRRNDLNSWLDSLIKRISDGIDSGIYEVIPYDRNKETEASDQQSISEKFFRDLLSFKAREGDVIWSDDRCVNGHFHSGEIPIIGINEVLKGLVGSGSISDVGYYNTITKLRAANVRFIPIEEEEILYHLSQARVENGSLIETRGLRILRRYVAACLLKKNVLQFPPMPENTSNRDGEIAFIMNLTRTVPDTIMSLWVNESSEEKCIAQSNWLIDNLYLEHHGLLKTIDKEQADQNDRHLAAISLSLLINYAISFSFQENENGHSKQRIKYYDWLYKSILHNKFEADPNLILEVADILKTSLISILDQKLDQDTADDVVKLLQLLYNDLPYPLREELSRDTDFIARIGFKLLPTAEAFGLHFDTDEFFQASSEAINGREAVLSTMEEDREVKFIPFKLDNGNKAICLDEPETEKKVIAEATLELLLESSEEREAVLRRNKSWFDCPKKTFEKAIAEIVSIEEPSRRIEKARSWIKNSAAVYYSKLYKYIETQPDFSISDLRPPSTEGLLRHYRLTADVEVGSKLHEWLESQAKDLIQDEGIKTAILRFSNLPISLPQALENAVLDLPDEEQHTLIKELLRTAGSPLAQIHFIHLLINTGDEKSSFWRLGKKIIRNLFSDEGKKKFSASLSVLRWVNEELNYWSEFRQLPSHIRLFMVWAHANELYRIFSGLGAPDSWLEEMFKDLSDKRLPFEIFGRDSDYWYDIAHPRRIQDISFFFHGLSYSIGDKADVFVDEKLKRLFRDQGFRPVENMFVPIPPLLLDSSQAQNNLQSFLGKDPGETVSSLLDNEMGARLTTASLQGMTAQAVEGLKEKDDRWFWWLHIQAILGDLPPYENLRDTIGEIILKTEFADMYQKDANGGHVALNTAILQAKQVGTKDISNHLKSELLKIVEYLEKESPEEPTDNSDDSMSKRVRLLTVFDAAVDISIAAGLQSQETITHFVEILSQIIEIWKDNIPDLEFMVRRFCKELPVSQAKAFWPLLIRLRAE